MVISMSMRESASSNNATVVCYPVENHPNDSRVKISKDGTVQTLSTRMGTGGGNVPLVMIEVKRND